MENGRFDDLHQPDPDEEMRSIAESDDDDDDRALVDHQGYRRSFIQAGGGDVAYDGEEGYEGVGAMDDDDNDLGAYVFSPLADPGAEEGSAVPDDSEFEVVAEENGSTEEDSQAGEERLQQEVDVLLLAKKYEPWSHLNQRQQLGGIIEPDVLGSIEVPPAYLKYGRWYTITQSILALFHCYALLLLTISSIPKALSLGLFVITTVALVIDIGLRTVTYMPRRSKLSLVFDVATLAASLVVLYSTSSASYQLVFLAILRGVRLFRIIFMFRDWETFHDIILIYKTISDSLQSLSILLIVALVGLFVTSTFIWAAETTTFDPATELYNRTCPLETPCETNLSPFQSIPDAMWLAVNCMTLVGLGDTYPVTSLGRLVAGCAIILGVFALALPTAVLIGNLQAVRIAAAANEEFHQTQLKQKAIEQLIARSIKESGENMSSHMSSDAASTPGISLSPEEEDLEDESLLEMDQSGIQPELDAPEGVPQIPSLVKKKKPPAGEFVFMSSKMREVREGPHGDYLYAPFMTIVNDTDGYPLVGNVTAITASSCVVTVFLCIDDPLARELATDCVKTGDAVVHCSFVGDLDVKLHSTEGSVVLYRNPGCGEVADCYIPIVFLVGRSAETIDAVREELVGTTLDVTYATHSFSSLVWRKTFHVTSDEFRESRFIYTLKEIAVAVSPFIFNSPDHAEDEKHQDDEVLKRRRSVAFIHVDHIPELFESVDDFFDLPPNTTIRNVYEVVQDITSLIVAHSREVFAKDIPPLLAKSVYDSEHVTLDDRLLEIDIDYYRSSDWPFGGIPVELVTSNRHRTVQVKIGDGDSSEGPQPVLGPRLATLRNGYSLAFEAGDAEVS